MSGADDSRYASAAENWAAWRRIGPLLMGFALGCGSADSGRSAAGQPDGGSAAAATAASAASPTQTPESAGSDAPESAGSSAAAAGSDPNAPTAQDGMEAGPNAGPSEPGETFQSGESLDPTATFDWPESPPGDGTDCPAGTYTGSFECTFTDTSGLLLLLPIVLAGPVSLTFEQSEDGEFLEITDGDFAAVANLVIGARAQIRGRLDCSTLMLDAMAVDGQWSFGDPDVPLIPGGGLEGQITGTLNPATGELSGEWTFGDPALGSCPGTWSVAYVP